MNPTRTIFIVLAVAAAFVAAGCGDDGHDHGDHMDDMHENMEERMDDKEGSGGGMDKTAAALAKLSPEHQKLAAEQKTCPVSGEPLGSMGTPIVVEAEGETVLLCCEACRKQFEKNPSKYVDK